MTLPTHSLRARVRSTSTSTSTRSWTSLTSKTTRGLSTKPSVHSPDSGSNAAGSGSGSVSAGKEVRRRGTTMSVEVDVYGDLVGPPDPISNLRPVIYRPIASTSTGPTSTSSRSSPPSTTRSTSSPNTTASSSERERDNPRTGRVKGDYTPYSISEFSASPSSSSNKTRSIFSRLLGRKSDVQGGSDGRLSGMKGGSGSEVGGGWGRGTGVTDRKLGEDLAGRLRREAVDRKNHEFWAKTNLLFNAHQAHRLAHLGPAPSQPHSTPAEIAAYQEKKDEVLSDFYRDWIKANRGRQGRWVAGWWADLREEVGWGLRKGWGRFFG